MSKLNLGANLHLAALMGMPHIGAHYTREDYRATKLDDNARCAVCGAPAVHAHHVVHRSQLRGYTIDTPLGCFTALSPLFAVCARCHDDFHAGRVKAAWEWNEGAMERWESGDILAHVCAPGSPKLNDYGRWIIT